MTSRMRGADMDCAPMLACTARSGRVCLATQPNEPRELLSSVISPGVRGAFGFTRRSLGRTM
eukprot:750693-Lingulodinium_polyedra.AAC.1